MLESYVYQDINASPIRNQMTQLMFNHIAKWFFFHFNDFNHKWTTFRGNYEFEYEAIMNASVNNTGDARLFITTHKTCRSGPVNLVLSRVLWQQLNIFIVNMTMKLPGTTSEWLNADDTSVFSSYLSGNDKPSKMNQSRINMALQSILVKLKRVSNISATWLRKAVVTHVRDFAPPPKSLLHTKWPIALLPLINIIYSARKN